MSSSAGSNGAASAAARNITGRMLPLFRTSRGLRRLSPIAAARGHRLGAGRLVSLPQQLALGGSTARQPRLQGSEDPIRCGRLGLQRKRKAQALDAALALRLARGLQQGAIEAELQAQRAGGDGAGAGVYVTSPRWSDALAAAGSLHCSSGCNLNHLNRTSSRSIRA